MGSCRLPISHLTAEKTGADSKRYRVQLRPDVVDDTPMHPVATATGEQKEGVRHNVPYPYPPSPVGSPHRADSARKQHSLQSVPSVASAHHASLSVVGEGASRQPAKALQCG